jgi:hypothetical protein
VTFVIANTASSCKIQTAFNNGAEDAAILQRVAHGVVTEKKRPEPRP